MKRNISVLLLVALLLTALVLPVQAEMQLSHVTDAAGLLSEQERADLEDLCMSVTALRSSAVYIITVDDFRDYGNGDVFEVTYGIYHDYGLGKGAGRDGAILLLSMADRDFAMFVYGDAAEYGLNAYAQEQVEGEFLPYFAENDWYGGFVAYVEACGSYLAMGDAGEPAEESPAMAILVAVLLSFLMALIICTVLKAGMKSVYVGAEAASYISVPLKLTKRHDQFTHKTQSRRKIESSSGSGSSGARVGGGGSGRSGKF